MLFIFLLITVSLWVLYFYKPKGMDPEKVEIKNMDGYVVTAILAALSAKGLLIMLEDNKDLSNKSLGEIEELLIERQIMDEEEWCSLCAQLGNDTLNLTIHEEGVWDLI